jgi:uncharacterized protein YndB with AHSA1/START domain
MSIREDYSPGAADMAHVEKNGEDWTLVLVKDLRHSPDKVWKALTDPAQLKEWAPFDANASLGQEGATVKLTIVGAPSEQVSETTITRAEEPKLLQYNWGGGETRWQLEPTADGTRLTLHAKIDRRFIAMGAAGWHVCFDVMERLLDEAPVGRHVGMSMMQDPGWRRLNEEYSKQFGVQTMAW